MSAGTQGHECLQSDFERLPLHNCMKTVACFTQLVWSLLMASLDEKLVISALLQHAMSSMDPCLTNKCHKTNTCLHADLALLGGSVCCHHKHAVTHVVM